MQRMGLNHQETTLVLRRVKKGTLKQVVPQYSTLKNAYTLLWDMEDNMGIYQSCCSDAEVL